MSMYFSKAPLSEQWFKKDALKMWHIIIIIHFNYSVIHLKYMSIYISLKYN